MTGPLTRTRLLAGAGLVAALNALAPRIAWSLDKGIGVSLAETLGVSAILWLALGVIAIIAIGNRQPDPAA